MLIRLRDSYATADGPVTLDVISGDGQKAFIEVSLNGNVLTSGSTIESFPLGLGKAIAGQRLRITSTVADTNPHTNHTSMTYELSGGIRDSSWVSDHDVATDGDTMDYDAIFNLL